MGRIYGVLTGHGQEIWYTDDTSTVDVLQRWSFIKIIISAVEVKYSLNMVCKDEVKAGHGP